MNSSQPLRLFKLMSTALPVKAARVAIPHEAGGVDPLKYMLPHEAEIFKDWGGRELPGSRLGPRVKSCHRVSAQEEGPLFCRLQDAKMGSLYTEGAIRTARAEARGENVDYTEELDTGGFFAARHKKDKDRLIYDRRPRNGKEIAFNWARLPNGGQWAQIVLPHNSCLRASQDDLSIYFYCLKQAPAALDEAPA